MTNLRRGMTMYRGVPKKAVFISPVLEKLTAPELKQLQKFITVHYVIYLTNGYSTAISREDLATIPGLPMSTNGSNGFGARWGRNIFDYSSVYPKNTKNYSANVVTDDMVTNIDRSGKHRVCGMFIWGRKRTKTSQRPISAAIKKEITKGSCVACGSNNVIPDHKNDFYNDKRVLSVHTQTLSDFQCLCEGCNLRKRNVCKQEKDKEKLFSANEIPCLNIGSPVYPWEKKAYNLEDPDCKKDTYWYDIIEFGIKTTLYQQYRIPVNKLVKRHIKLLI